MAENNEVVGGSAQLFHESTKLKITHPPLAVAGQEQRDLYDKALQDVNFESVQKENKRIEAVKNWPEPSLSINVSSRTSIRPNHTPQCSERPQPDQPRTPN